MVKAWFWLNGETVLAVLVGILLGVSGHMFLGWLFAHLSIGWQ